MIPPNMGFQKDGISIKITYRWISWTYLFFPAIIIITGYMVFGRVIPSAGALSLKTLPPEVLLLFLALAISFYVSVTYIINRTFIIMDDKTIRVYHFPLPWPGNKTLNLIDTDRRIYCTQHEQKDKWGNVSYYYSVDTFTEGGRRIVILGNIKDYSQALFIKEKMHKHLSVSGK